MKGVKKLTKEDKALWQVFVRQITPLKTTAAVEIVVQAPEIKAIMPVIMPMPPSPPIKLKPLTPLSPIEKNIKTALKRGTIEPTLKLDLHGMTQDNAYVRLLSFLEMAYARQEKIVIVVTGKGKITGETGVLRRSLPGWLTNPALRHIIMGYEEAGLPHGGSGALYIRIRRRK